jgi:RimJ/RimL family protein N-acetyltransferase
MNVPTLTTQHLFLRPWSLEDDKVLFSILHEENILCYFPDPSPPSVQKVDQYITHHLAHWENYGYGHWAVVTREEGLVVGWNGLEYLSEISEIEVAYLLSKRVWGRGYATEAAQAAVHFGFEHANLDAIIGLVHSENIGSVRVLEKCGLSFVNRISLWGMVMSRYRLLRSDFQQLSITPQK